MPTMAVFSGVNPPQGGPAGDPEEYATNVLIPEPQESQAAPTVGFILTNKIDQLQAYKTSKYSPMVPASTTILAGFSRKEPDDNCL